MKQITVYAAFTCKSTDDKTWTSFDYKSVILYQHDGMNEPSYITNKTFECTDYNGFVQGIKSVVLNYLNKDVNDFETWTLKDFQI